VTTIARHAALALGEDSGGAPVRRLLHAHVWARLEVREWGERRELHLHLVAEPGRELAWRPVDLSRRPLRRAAGAEPPLPAGVEGSLRRLLADRRAILWRSPDLGLVSEPDEPLEAFRSRVLALARPALGRRLEEVRSARPPRLPWRRRVWARRLAARREELAAALHRMAARLERREVELAGAGALRVEVGWLLLPAGVELPAPALPVDPMVRGPARGSEP